MRHVLIIAVLAVWPLLAQAVTLDKPLVDHAQELRAQELFAQMRCVVCEGQPLAESDARHAVDMRTTIRQMIARGDSDDVIYAFFQTRYGDAIFMRPPSRGFARPLWLAPFIMLAVGVGIMLMMRARKEG